jgi:transposase
VSQERLSMRKIKEVLRLRSLGRKQREIAGSCSISQSTVHEYLKAAKAAGKNWPEIADWDDVELEKALFSQRPVAIRRPAHSIPDFANIHHELQNHKHVTLQLVWEEYRQAHPDCHGYSRFCDLYRSWLQKRDLVLRQQHRAGEKLFVDHAGDTIPLTNRETGEITPAYLFVAVLGASSYTYAEATQFRDLPNWIGSHVRAFEYFSGVPEIVVPDNWKTAVTRACRYEPDLNRTYSEMAQHYHVAIIPARAGKPRDKAKVAVREGGEASPAHSQLIRSTFLVCVAAYPLLDRPASEIVFSRGALLQNRQSSFRKKIRCGCKISPLSRRSARVPLWPTFRKSPMTRRHDWMPVWADWSSCSRKPR